MGFGMSRPAVAAGLSSAAAGAAIVSALGAGCARRVGTSVGQTRSSPTTGAQKITFGRIAVDPSSVFCRVGAAVALRDLQPVLPGHAVVLPSRRVLQLSELSTLELDELFECVRTAQYQLQQDQPTAVLDYNIAVHDGPAAGQAVPHCHVHIVPRVEGDLEDNDQIYELLRTWEPRPGERSNNPPPFEVPEDATRKPRTAEEMASEARTLAALVPKGEGRSALPSDNVRFGRLDISPGQVFFRSESALSLAIVNLKPLCPGHVLVVPARVVAKLDGLTSAEQTDLWRTSRIVQSIVQTKFSATCSLIGVQDGRAAGQSVPHVHVHILPQPSLQS